MKFIKKFKSVNYNNRKSSNIKYIIIHYTALEDCNKALDFLCSKEKKVSCHYLISQNGKIYNLVNERKRAWHAGLSYWKGDTDINSNSLGIELDYSFNNLNNKFTLMMMKSLSQLIEYLINKYKIDTKNVLGHSDIAPFRKQDPGKYFPWDYLVKKKLAFIPRNKSNRKFLELNEYFKTNGFKTKKKIAIHILNKIGYDTMDAKTNTNKFEILIRMYQTHYLQSNISSKIDKITFNYLCMHYLNLVLNKNEKIIIMN